MKVRILTIGALGIVLALAGCTTQTASTADPTVAVTATATASASPTAPATIAASPTPTETAVEESPTPSPEPVVPTSCDGVGATDVRESFTAGMRNQPGIGLKGDNMPPSATLLLDCVWFGGDVSGISVQYAHVPTADGETKLEEWRESGAACDEAPAYSWCVREGTFKYNTFDIAEKDWVMFDGSLWVRFHSSHVDATEFQQSVAAQLWG